jgi:hypothetical protein
MQAENEADTAAQKRNAAAKSLLKMAPNNTE